MQKLVRFSFGAAKEQFSKFYILQIQLKEDAYYITSAFQQQFRDKIAAIEKSQSAYIIGGNNFPMTSTTLVFNCDGEQTVRSFAEQNIYNKKQLVESYSLEEVDRISSDKFNKLAAFYQVK